MGAYCGFMGKPGSYTGWRSGQSLFSALGVASSSTTSHLCHGNFRVPFLQFGICQGSGTSGRGGQDAGKGSFGTGNESGIRVLQLFVYSPEGIGGRGSWRPMISFSGLSGYVMGTISSVLRLIRKGNVMFLIDLKDIYFQIPLHLSLVLSFKLLSEARFIHSVLFASASPLHFRPWP